MDAPHVCPCRAPETAEGRPGNGWAARVKKNDWVTFKVSKSGGKKLVCRVKAVRAFDTVAARPHPTHRARCATCMFPCAQFEAMLKAMTLRAMLPDCKGGLAAGVAIYRSFGTMSGQTYEELEAESGAIALEVEPL